MAFNLFRSILSLSVFAVVVNFAIPQAQALRNELYVTSLGTDKILRYDGNTGEFQGTFISGDGRLNAPDGLVFGPDGNVYVSGFFSDNIIKYDGRTGEYLSTFASGIKGPTQVVFDRDGNLLVNSYGDQQVNSYGDQTGCSATNSCSVLKYDGKTGAFLGVFASGGGLNGPDGLVFGPDGALYVSSFRSNQILKYDGNTGDFLEIFASGADLDAPSGFVFGPDSNLYATSWNTNQVLKYDGKTGAFLRVFASGGDLDKPNRLAFGPDSALYVSSIGSDKVLKYDGETGVFLGTFISGTRQPTDLIFVPIPESSFVLGIFVFGALGGITLLKRKL